MNTQTPSSRRRDTRRPKGIAAALIILAALFLAIASTGATAAEAPPVFWTKCPTGSGAGQCSIPRGIGVDPSAPGHLYVSDQNNSRIVELSAWGEFVKAWGWDVVATGPGDDTSAPEDRSFRSRMARRQRRSDRCSAIVVTPPVVCSFG